jgi:hypothetical protein
MSDKAAMEIKFNNLRHDLINVLQGIYSHHEIALKAAEKCDDLHKMEINACFNILEFSAKEAKNMLELAERYGLVINEMNTLAREYYERFPIGL